MSSFKKYARITGVVIILVLFGIFSFYYWGKYSIGFRSGVVMKLSKKGNLFKTFEGELKMDAGELIQPENNDARVWYFSVPKKKKDIVEELREVSLSGERVSLEYYQRYWKVPWRGKTEYFVVGVKRE